MKTPSQWRNNFTNTWLLGKNTYYNTSIRMIYYNWMNRHDGYVYKNIMGYPCNDNRRDMLRFWIRIYRQSIK